MTDAAGSSGDQLREGILNGQVPRQVRLFAAQGLLPLSRDEIFRLQTVLSADSDEELAEMAAASLREQSPQLVSQWLENHDVTPIELDLVARVIRDEAVWASVARHPNVSDETLCVLAENATPMVQDVIITNQVRLLACLEILEALRVNPQATQVVLRRVREFEEEFITKMVKSQGELEPEEMELESPTIEEVVTDLRSIGGQLPSEEELPFPEHEDPALAEEVRKLGESAFSRLLKMDTKERVLVAIKGSMEERAILINSRNKLVLRGVLSSPKLTDMEVERFASSKSLSDEVVRVIAANPKWMRMYPVVLALVKNPKTPVMAAIRLLGRISVRDMKRIEKDRSISSNVRRKATEMLSRKRT